MLNRYVCTLAAGLIVAGCAHPTSGRYEGAEVGKPIETSRGTVVSGRVVDVTGETNPAGPLAGAAIGGAGVGLGTHSGWAAILGAVVGAGIGYATQQLANDRDGIEYIVDMEDGRTVTLVQNREESETPLPPGTVVLVQVSGEYSRVIPRTPSLDRPLDRPGAGGAPAVGAAAPAEGTGSGGVAGGGWIDPDKPLAPPSTTSPTSTTSPPSPSGQPRGQSSTQTTGGQTTGGQTTGSQGSGTPSTPLPSPAQSPSTATPLVATGQSTTGQMATAQATANGTDAGQASASRPSGGFFVSSTATSWAVPPPEPY